MGRVELDQALLIYNLFSHSGDPPQFIGRYLIVERNAEDSSSGFHPFIIVNS
jgi:hypothetical protein